VALVIAGKPTTAANPSQRPLNTPPLWQHHEAVPVTAAHDLQFPNAGSRDNGLHLLPLIARICDDALHKRKAAARLPQQRLGPVPVLHMGRMNRDGQQEAKRVGQDVALATKDLLARIKAGRVERRPPLRAPRTVWLSMIAVVGLASRPAVSRVST
jgi:hypothetical protein